MIFHYNVGNLLQALPMCSPLVPGGTTRGTSSATWGLSSPLYRNIRVSLGLLETSQWMQPRIQIAFL